MSKDLEAAIEALRARQRASIAAAIDAALEGLPRIMRGTIRKVLFPGGS
ncbi:MAG: hypothetical protein NT062_22335 [Proteobacteria bacterium]|nr:hypothetical protein [Pseudomonadota bacterium]